MKQWIRYVKPYKCYFILGPLCMIVEVIGEVLMPRYLSQIINVGVAEGKVSYIIGVCAAMVLSALCMMAGGVGGSYFGAKGSVYFASDVREDVFRKVQSFSFADIDRFSTGSLVTRLTNDIQQVQNLVSTVLRMFLRAPGMLIGALIMAISMNASLSLVLAVALPIVLGSLLLVIGKGFRRFSAMQGKIDSLNSRIQENLTNVRVIKSFVREDYELGRFSDSNNDLKDATLSAMGVMITMMPMMMLFMNFTSVAVLWFGGKQVMAGAMDVGDLTAFVTYITQILSSLMMVVMMLLQSSRALASARRIKEVLNAQTDLSDESARCPDAVVKKGEITFENVDFRYYKTAPEKVLDNVSFTIPAGTTMGIIGSTGGGKSTLVSLIARLYDADAGRVLVDGIDVRDYRFENLRGGIGMVLQKNVLFSGSIRENLLWGDDTATDEEICKMSEYAQADGFVQSLADGYASQLDAGGANLSGGQKQRLCIARALLKKPKILILDDSTSAVDTATEQKIRAAFASELADCTKIIIAQRISSVREADCIIVMNNGVVSGMGTHEELMKSNEAYKEIYDSQMTQKED